MVPMQGFSFEQQGGEHSKDNQRNHFLNHFQLHQRKGSAIAGKAYAIGRHLGTVLKKSNYPRKENDSEQGPIANGFCLLKFEMTVPGKSHENIGYD